MTASRNMLEEKEWCSAVNIEGTHCGINFTFPNGSRISVFNHNDMCILLILKTRFTGLIEHKYIY